MKNRTLDSEHFLFKLRKVDSTLNLKSRKKKTFDNNLISKYLSSTNVSLSITQDKAVHFPEVSKTQVKLKYIESYKNLEKIIDRESHNKHDPSPIISYLTKLKTSQLIPETMGLLKKNNNDSVLDVSHYSMGNSYAEALSEGIQYIKLKKVLLKNNRLSDEGASAMMKKLNASAISEIDLSQNTIGLNTVANICRITDIDESKLRVINLNQNNLGDRAIILLCSVLSSNDRIIELSLAENNITEVGSNAIAEYIITTQVLQKLDLHWNNIKGDGAKSLGKALCENNSIKILDLSWNAIGSPAKDNSIPMFAKAIKVNSRIYHLDLSNNNLNEAACKLIGEALLDNKTLVGLHMDGNWGILDNKGFLQINLASSRARNLHIYKKMFSKKGRNLENCWVCNQWSEIVYTIKPKEKVTSVFLHLDFYNYEPEIMEKCNDRSFKITLISPPSQIKFWFSANDIPFVISDYSIGKYTELLKFKELKIESYNFIVGKKSHPKTWHEFHPRLYPRMTNSGTQELENWNIKLSMFKDYIIDTPKLSEQCFDFDWFSSRIQPLFAYDVDRCIEILKKNYVVIREIYKYIAACSKNNRKSWQDNIVDLFVNARILDNNFLKNSDVASIVRSTKTNESYSPSEIPRYQFLEIIIKAIFTRFYKSNICSQSDACEILVKEFNNLPQFYFSNDFRVKKYLTAAMDKVLKKHLQWLLSTYNLYEKNGVITFKDFGRIVGGYTKNEDYVLKNCILAKENNRYDKFYQQNLRFPEFLEAFVRVIDGERVDQDLKRLNLYELIDIVINDYFKNGKAVARINP